MTKAKPQPVLLYSLEWDLAQGFTLGFCVEGLWPVSKEAFRKVDFSWHQWSVGQGRFDSVLMCWTIKISYLRPTAGAACLTWGMMRLFLSSETLVLKYSRFLGIHRKMFESVWIITCSSRQAKSARSRSATKQRKHSCTAKQGELQLDCKFQIIFSNWHTWNYSLKVFYVSQLVVFSPKSFAFLFVNSLSRNEFYYYCCTHETLQ